MDKVIWHFWGGESLSRWLFTTDNEILIAGSRPTSTGSGVDFYLLGTNLAGDSLWSRTYGTDADDVLYSVVRTSDGGFIFVGDNASGIYVVRTTPVLDTPDAPHISVTTLSLHPNFPNPFNSTTEIAFELPKAGNVSLKVFDLLGRDVATVQEGMMTAGSHRLLFDGKGLSSGVYVYRLQTAKAMRAGKMVLLK